MYGEKLPANRMLMGSLVREEKVRLMSRKRCEMARTLR